jgi:hypothetical protein
MTTPSRTVRPAGPLPPAVHVPKQRHDSADLFTVPNPDLTRPITPIDVRTAPIAPVPGPIPTPTLAERSEPVTPAARPAAIEDATRSGPPASGPSASGPPASAEPSTWRSTVTSRSAAVPDQPPIGSAATPAHRPAGATTATRPRAATAVPAPMEAAPTASATRARIPAPFRSGATAAFTSSSAPGAPRPTPPNPPAVRPRNGLGVTALACAPASLTLLLSPAYWMAAVTLGAAAMFFGILGVQRALRGQADNDRMAMAAAVAGGVAVLLGVVIYGPNLLPPDAPSRISSTPHQPSPAEP